MKAAKRIFLILLAALMIAVAIPITVSAANVCTINGTYYTSFADALAAAKASTTDVEIVLLADVSTSNGAKLENDAYKKVTLDGNGHTLTANTYNGLCVYTNAVIKNLDISHNNEGSAIQIYKHPNSSTINVNVENVDVDSSAKRYRKFTVINALGSENTGGATVTLGLTNVNVVLDADPVTSNAGLSAVRTGNGHDTVNMEIVNCNFDVSASLDAKGIDVVKGTVATVNVRDTNIKTNLGYPIAASDQTVNVYGGSLMTSGFDYKTNPYNAVGGKTKTNFYTSSGAVIVPDLYIYGCQETSPSGGFFKTRFICAAKEDKLSTYKNIKMVVTVANASTVLPSQTYNVSTMYDSLKAGSGIASEAGYCFGTAEMQLQSNYDQICTVELYATVNGVESMYDSETFTYASGAYADSEYDAFDYTISRKDLTGRYLLVSDLHYVGDGTGGRNSGDTDRRTYRGATNAQRMQLLCDSIEQEYKLRGLDGILVLGDLSTDDWYSGCSTSTWLPEQYCYKVYTDYLKPLADRLGIDIRVIAGNHDSYYNSWWKTKFGYDRQYTYVDGDNVFIMIDNFGGDVDANDAEGAGNGSEWRETDTAWLKTQLDLYASKKNIFLCSHEFGTCSDALKNLLANYNNVVALFEGHTHHFSGSSLFGKTGLPLFNTGNFSYGVYDHEYSGDFGKLCDGCGTDYNCLWGFQIIETSASNVTSYRVDVPHEYKFNTYTPKTAIKTGTITHDQPYVKYDDIILK